MMNPKDLEPPKDKISVVRFIPAQQNESASNVRRALIHHFLPTETDLEATLSISNKYFDAKVRFSDIGNTILADKNHLWVEDGIILTFQDSKTNAITMRESFDALDSVHTSAQPCGDVLRLCVGIQAVDDGANLLLDESLLEQEYQRRILWCLDRGYEYIEADMTEEGRKKGHEDREKEGYARILEAFQGTIWSSAVRVGGAKDDLVERKVSNSSKAVVDGDALESKVSDVATKIPDLHPTDESYFENLDRVMREAIRIREDARSGTLTDEERRKRAGDAATALMGLLGQMGLDEDEEDSDNE